MIRLRFRGAALALVAALWLALPAAADFTESPNAEEGQQLVEQGQWEPARAVLEAAVRRAPEDSAVLYWLARCCEQMADYDRASELLGRLQSLPAYRSRPSGPVEQMARSLRERLAVAQRLLDQARANMVQLALRPKAANLLSGAALLVPRLWEVWLERGRLAALTGSHDDAANHYRQAIALRGDRPELHGYLALSLFHSGPSVPDVLDKVFDEAQRAVELRGGDPRSSADDGTDFDLMGVARYNQGRYREAAELFRKAAELAPAVGLHRQHQELAERRAGR